MYRIQSGERVVEVAERAQALSQARSWSADGAGMVQVENDNRRERLTYRRGELVQVEMFTNKKKS